MIPVLVLGVFLLPLEESGGTLGGLLLPLPLSVGTSHTSRDQTICYARTPHVFIVISHTSTLVCVRTFELLQYLVRTSSR